MADIKEKTKDESWTKTERKALARLLSRVAFALVGRPVKVSEAVNGELGYTIQSGKTSSEIWVAFDHDYYKGLTKAQKTAFIYGTALHEMLHQICTDFNYYTGAIKTRPKEEQHFMSEILNVMEDSAIEYQAPDYMSDEYVHYVDYMRAKVYERSPMIDEFHEPFTQFMAAACQYGDAGVIKGEFKSEEAKEAFVKSLPLMDECVSEYSPKKRTALCKQVFEITRPLWERDAEALERLKKELERLSQERSSALEEAHGERSGKPSGAPPESHGSHNEKRQRFKRRESSRRELEKSGNEKDEGEGASGEKSEDKDEKSRAASGSSDETEKTNADEAESVIDGSDGEKKEEAEGEAAADGGSEKSDDGNDGNDSKDSDNKGIESDNSSSGEENETDAETGDEVKNGESEGGSGEIPHPGDEDGASEDDTGPEEDVQDSEELELSEEELDSIVSALADAEKEVVEEEDSGGMDFSVSDGYKGACRKAKCLNLDVTVDSPKVENYYRAIANDISGDIKHLSGQLERILKNKREETVYRSSGKVSVKMLSNGHMTTRVFSRRREPNKHDVAVCVAVDMSGSMAGPKIRNARTCAIGLAEVFAKLNIPLYLYGFTADSDKTGDYGYDYYGGFYHAVHYHFIKWGHNTQNDRVKLMSMCDVANNFDGYSIRYGTELLKKINADTKLFIVISDGAPVCHAYDNYETGINDTRQAIKEASKSATVIGVLIGGDPELHRTLYGYNFIYCAEPTDLFHKLGKAVANFMKE